MFQPNVAKITGIVRSLVHITSYADCKEPVAIDLVD